MTVWRETELPRCRARGRLIVAAHAASATSVTLQGFRGRDGAHEGLVYWCGRTVDADTYVLCALLPDSEHGRQHVHADEASMGRVARMARAHQLGVVAQVHSHPGKDTRHSDGDDHLVFMRFEGMFSLVVADYGRGSVRPEQGAGLHQFQDGRWVWVTNAAEALVLVPEMIDARE